jgi:hypothetical protein
MLQQGLSVYLFRLALGLLDQRRIWNRNAIKVDCGKTACMKADAMTDPNSPLPQLGADQHGSDANLVSSGQKTVARFSPSIRTDSAAHIVSRAIGTIGMKKESWQVFGRGYVPLATYSGILHL